jgi:ABC-type cobalamin/Fe3+-siderophores transport system ATPase subunit
LPVTRFINRERELETLLRLAEAGTPLPLYIYGPEGCGKTRLLREFAGRLTGDYVVVYIDAQREDPSEALHVRPAEAALQAVQSIAEAAGSLAGLVRLVGRLVELLARRILLRGRRLVVIVDDAARPLGPRQLEGYVKSLQQLTEELPERYELTSILTLVSTSEGESLERISRHSYADIRLLWNLPPQAARRLAAGLGVEDEKADQLVAITGGNPRAIIEAAVNYQADISLWLRNTVKPRVLRAARRARERNVDQGVRAIAENPDAVYENPEPQIVKAYKLLLRENMVIDKSHLQLHGEELKPNPEMAIGKYVAWQLPAYRDEMLKVL